MCQNLGHSESVAAIRGQKIRADKQTKCDNVSRKNATFAELHLFAALFTVSPFTRPSRETRIEEPKE